MSVRRLLPYSVGETLRLRPPAAGAALLVISPSGHAQRDVVATFFDVELDEPGDWRYAWDGARATRVTVLDTDDDEGEPEEPVSEAAAGAARRVHGIVEAG